MADPFTLAPTGDDELLDFLDSSGKQVEPLGPPGVWHHFGRGLGDSVMQGLARTGRAAAVAGSVFVPNKAKDWYFGNVVDGLGTDAVNAWAPNAADVGTAGQAFNGLISTLVPLAVSGGNPAALLGTVALDTPVDLINQGASLGSALGVGAIQTAAVAAGFRLPAAWGNTLVQRLATGAGGNLAIGAASRDLSGRALEAGGSDALAESYRGDATAAIIDIGMGLAFGGLAHATTPSQRAAVLTARNAHHFENTAHPGAPADGASAVAAQDVLGTAIRQALSGERVNVADAIRAADFTPTQRALLPDVAGALDEIGAGPLARYEQFRRTLESGGRADAKNPNSSALGADQFTAGTWRSVVAIAKPEWAQGLDDKQLLALRTDPDKSAEMAAVLDRENAAMLNAAGVPVDNFTLYAAHHFGAERAIAFGKADDGAKVDTFLTTAQIKANPYLKGMSKGELVDNWQKRAGMAVDPDVGAALALTGQQPDALIVDGFDGDNAPRYRSATEVMAEIDSERQAAINDAEAYAAAVECHLRRGMTNAA